MSLRRRLVLLLVAFAVYAVLAAALAIYGSQWRIDRAARDFQVVSGQTTQIEKLELLLTEQVLLLRSLAQGQPPAGTTYADAKERWESGLRQLTAFAPRLLSDAARSELLSAADSFENASTRFLRMIEEQRFAEAGTFMDHQLGGAIVPELSRCFAELKELLDDVQNDSARRLAFTSFELLGLATAVGSLAALLVVGGSVLIHRWLIRPIDSLQAAARHFAAQDLSYRTSIDRNDELGELGAAMNEMAQAISVSERKQQTLFSNLRDAFVICDEAGRILEYHDGETKVLGVEEGSHTGRGVLEVWPEWRPAARDWEEVIHAAACQGRRILLHNVHLASPASGRNGPVVDFVVYRIECGGRPCTAIVVRDSTERHRMQLKLQHAETMKAIGDMASGFAHDVNNLLACVTGTLSSLAGELRGTNDAERIQAALRACKRAAGLVKRLLHFARGVQGSPQVFRPAEIIETILGSMEPSFFAKLSVSRELDHSIRVRMDQDQFAQVLLNLLRNARDAMPEDGAIIVRLESTRCQHPEIPGADQPYALLTLKDTGPGIPPEFQSRIFEPFFTTKSVTALHGRGMGLAIVYSNVKNAGGFIQVESEVAAGTSIRVYLPLAGATHGSESTELSTSPGDSSSIA